MNSEDTKKHTVRGSAWDVFNNNKKENFANVKVRIVFCGNGKIASISKYDNECFSRVGTSKIIGF